MTSVRRTAAVILLFTAIAAASPFVRGTRFGTIGLDYRHSSGDLYTYSYNKEYVELDPLLRAGIAVSPNLTVGGEFALFNTFAESVSIFASTPVFGFGPSATCYFIPSMEVVQPYATAGVGATYAFAWDRLAWRARLGAGLAVVMRRSVALALEGGWYGDLGQASFRSYHPYGYRQVWLRGGSWFAGVRVMAFN